MYCLRTLVYRTFLLKIDRLRWLNWCKGLAGRLAHSARVLSWQNTLFGLPVWKANCCVQWPELASQMMVVC